MIRYTVKTIRSGQPRSYADTEREYKIFVERATGYGEHANEFQPWIFLEDVEARITTEAAMRKAGKLFGGNTPEDLRKMQRDWALKITRALCQNFREKDDDDGRTGMDAAFYPTLKWLKLDAAAGTIHVFITEMYTD